MLTLCDGKCGELVVADLGVMAVKRTRKFAGLDVEGVVYPQVLTWQSLDFELLRIFLLYFRDGLQALHFYIIRHFHNNPQEIKQTRERESGEGLEIQRCEDIIFISK